jgi:NADH dehydrogenase FAD-containing subunit
VTIIEMQPSLAPEMARNNRTDILLRLKRAGTAIYVDTVIEGTEGERIRLNRNGEASEITCPPHVVLATGSAPRADLASALEKAGVSFVVAGDAQVPGDFQSAIRDGQMAGLAVERRLDKAEAPKRPAHRTEAALG